MAKSSIFWQKFREETPLHVHQLSYGHVFFMGGTIRFCSSYSKTDVIQAVKGKFHRIGCPVIRRFYSYWWDLDPEFLLPMYVILFLWKNNCFSFFFQLGIKLGIWRYQLLCETFVSDNLSSTIGKNLIIMASWWSNSEIHVVLFMLFRFSKIPSQSYYCKLQKKK